MINGNACKAYWLSTGTRASWGGSVDAEGFYLNTPPTDLSELTEIVDATISDGGQSEDVTTRSGGGTRQNKVVLDELEITFNLKCAANNTGLLALRKAKNTKGTVALAFLTGDKAVAGSYGYWADFSVSTITEAQPIGGTVTWDITVTNGKSSVPAQKVKTDD